MPPTESITKEKYAIDLERKFGKDSKDGSWKEREVFSFYFY